jgi:hypothetical protein
MSLSALRREFPWPNVIPDVPDQLGGWFCGENQEILRRHLSPTTELVVELGSWQGMSARFIAAAAPRANLICIDHWEGSPEHKAFPEWARSLPTLYETFLRNLWEFRDRVVPLKCTTQKGLERIAAAGLTPDLIYLDAAHDASSVLADVSLALRLFPKATLVGDDWSWNSVKAGVCWAFKDTMRKLESLGVCWYSLPETGG